MNRPIDVANASALPRHSVRYCSLIQVQYTAYGSLGVPVALTAIPFVLGLLLLPLAIETRGKPLPV